MTLGAGGIGLAAAAVVGLALVAAGLGHRAGVRRERAALRRHLHDTVLPALDSFALAGAADPATATDRLAALRRAARAEAAALRRGLADPGGWRAAGPLDRELRALVDELARTGLRTELVIVDRPASLPARRRAALRDATREALRNTVRHSGSRRATVRVERRDGGIAVVTRDEGVGFDPLARRGFGISESIVARMAEVGGRADIESRAGWGTRVAVWVPR
ncbi:sensor histidine kinase [Plantactinospora sonchi]|uniref:ATP-binding protein n=1 Tax=Plantactinospora sonchi TaxID=1544735 RepID=A0ABU7RXX2_9ACTN